MVIPGLTCYLSSDKQKAKPLSKMEPTLAEGADVVLIHLFKIEEKFEIFASSLLC